MPPSSTDRGKIHILEHVSTQQQETQESKEEKAGSLVDNELLLSHISKHMIVFFAEQKFPSSKVHLFMPFVSYLRNVVKLVLVFLLRNSPEKQFKHVLILIVIEMMYMMTHMIYNNKIDKIEKIVDGYNCISNSLYVILKMVTLFTKNDNTKPKTIGMIMVVLLFINIGVNVSFVVYSMIRYMIHVIKKGIERCRLTDEQKKMNDRESKWKETCVYEYTDRDMVIPAIEKPEDGE